MHGRFPPELLQQCHASRRMDQGIRGFPSSLPLRLSHEAFPQGCPTCHRGACPHSRRELTPLGRLQKYPKVHVSTGEESLGYSNDSIQGLMPQHRRERNPERPPSSSHGDRPFLRPPESVPEVPVVSGEHLPQLEKIQEVLPSRRDEAHFR